MIRTSLVIAALESYEMASTQIRYLASLLPADWELIFIDDGSWPPITVPDERPKHFLFVRMEAGRRPGEWTQHLAINRGVAIARGSYVLKLDIDHVLTSGAVSAASNFQGDMLLFHRKCALFSDDLRIHPLDIEVTSPVDDIYVIRREIFTSLGGYPANVQRNYGGAGKFLWSYSRRPEAQPSDSALIYVVPDSHARYHPLERIA